MLLWFFPMSRLYRWRPLNSEVIIQSDSDEEFPEPVMLRADGRSWNNNLPTAVSSVDVAKMQPSEHIKGIRDKRDQPIRIATEPKISEEKVDTLKLSASQISEEREDPLDLSASKIAEEKKILLTFLPLPFHHCTVHWNSKTQR